MSDSGIHTLPWGKALVIIPTYNEIENIGHLLGILQQLYPHLNILVIDDNSPDGTAGVVKERQEGMSGLFLMEREGKQGLCSAYLAGFKWALEKGYRYVFEMDSDFSHSPEELPTLLREAASGADLVVGSRYIGGIRVMNWPFRRLLISYLGGIYIRLLTGIPLRDSTGGFKCFSRRALESLERERVFSRGYVFQLELNYKVWRLGLAIKEVPVTFYERKRGVSKMSLDIIVEAFYRVIHLRCLDMLGRLIRSQ